MEKRYRADHTIVHDEPSEATLLDSLMFLRRSGVVERYHTEDVIKRQNVAEHSYGVAWLCWLLTGGHASGALIMGALAHDASEHGTGDIPSPTKRYLGIGKNVDLCERRLMIHNDIWTEDLSDVDERILKIADALDGVLYCLREREKGNTTLLQVFKNFVGYVEHELVSENSPASEETIEGRAKIIINYAKERYNECQ